MSQLGHNHVGGAFGRECFSCERGRTTVPPQQQQLSNGKGDVSMQRGCSVGVARARIDEGTTTTRDKNLFLLPSHCFSSLPLFLGGLCRGREEGKQAKMRASRVTESISESEGVRRPMKSGSNSSIASVCHLFERARAVNVQFFFSFFSLMRINCPSIKVS